MQKLNSFMSNKKKRENSLEISAAHICASGVFLFFFCLTNSQMKRVTFEPKIYILKTQMRTFDLYTANGNKYNALKT